MTAARKKPTSKAISRLTDEFTSGQLVTGMVVCLVFVLCCFLVGILVGKLDPSARDEGHPQVTGPESSDAAPVQDRQVQASRPVPPTTPAGSATPYTRPEERTDGARRVSLPPLQPTRDPPAMSPHKVTKQDAPKIPETPTPTTPPEPEAATVETTPATSSPEVPATPPPAPAKPAPSTPATEDAGPLRGYGIQLAAFGGENRVTEAEEYRRRLRENAGKDARVLNEGSWCKVVLVGYNDETEAKAACADLRKTPAFEKAWVRTFP